MFADTLDSGFLTNASIGLGVATTLVVRLYQKWRHARSINILIEYSPGRLPFHSKALNLPIIAFFATMGICVFITITNHKFASQEETVKSFTVSSVGIRTLRYNQHHIIGITDGVYYTDYDIGRDNSKSYKVGDSVKMEVKEGFWGFSIVTLIE